jgi:hypothetical protein
VFILYWPELGPLRLGKTNILSNSLQLLLWVQIFKSGIFLNLIILGDNVVNVLVGPMLAIIILLSLLHHVNIELGLAVGGKPVLR